MPRNKHLGTLIDDISNIRELVRDDKINPKVVIDYIESNRKFIEYSLGVFAEMETEHKEHYLDLHRGLDPSALSPTFVKLPLSTLEKIDKIKDKQSLIEIFPIRDDELHMLQRALRYVSYTVSDHGYLPIRFIEGEIRAYH